MVQWLRFCTSNAGGAGPTPCHGTEIPHVMRRGQKKKKISIFKRLIKSTLAFILFLHYSVLHAKEWKGMEMRLD